MKRLLRTFDPRLPREVWLLQLGGVVNSFGNGVVLPFLVIYLHDVRGFSLGTSGLVVAVASAAQLVAGIGSGPVIDLIGPKRTLAAGLVLQAVGFGLLPVVRHPWEAFALVAIEARAARASGPASRRSCRGSRRTPAATRRSRSSA